MPVPWRATLTDPHSLHTSGTRSRWPQWWQASVRPARCRTSETSQFGQLQAWPQTRQSRKFDQPRRLSSTIALRASVSAWTVRGCRAPSVPRMSTISTSGSDCPSTRRGRRSRRSALTLSGRGVALPTSSTASWSAARFQATRRAS